MMCVCVYVFVYTIPGCAVATRRLAISAPREMCPSEEYSVPRRDGRKGPRRQVVNGRSVGGGEGSAIKQT